MFLLKEKQVKETNLEKICEWNIKNIKNSWIFEENIINKLQFKEKQLKVEIRRKKD